MRALAETDPPPISTLFSDAVSSTAPIFTGLIVLLGGVIGARAARGAAPAHAHRPGLIEGDTPCAA